MLSPLPFLVLLDWFTRESCGSEKTGIQWTLTRQLVDIKFADDLCLLSHKVSHMRQKVNILKINSGGTEDDVMAQKRNT